MGLGGHSDADVLIHSICDALLGAAGEGELGEIFPDTDPRYKNISSIKLLVAVVSRIATKGYRPVNVDSVIIAQEPRLAPFLPQMRQSISRSIGLEEGAVNIKVKTNEGLGFIGRGEGIAAQAVATLLREN